MNVESEQFMPIKSYNRKGTTQQWTMTIKNLWSPGGARPLAQGAAEPCPGGGEQEGEAGQQQHRAGHGRYV